MNRLERAKELREEADRLEAEEVRLMPDKWEIGMRVRFLRSAEWAWSKGTEATVIKLDESCKGRRGDEYQVFWTEPDGGGATWWTTPDDVELVMNSEKSTNNQLYT